MTVYNLELWHYLSPVLRSFLIDINETKVSFQVFKFVSWIAFLKILKRKILLFKFDCNRKTNVACNARNHRKTSFSSARTIYRGVKRKPQSAFCNGLLIISKQLSLTCGIISGAQAHTNEAYNIRQVLTNVNHLVADGFVE